VENRNSQIKAQKNLTQRRKGAKGREKPRQQEFTTETQRTLRSEARALIKIAFPFYLCVFASLREILVSLVIGVMEQGE
jgi:Flp pilus assembly protein TadB